MITCYKHRMEKEEKYAGLTIGERLLKIATEAVEYGPMTGCSNPPCRLASQIEM